MKSVLGFWTPWVIGVIITAFAISLWRNGEIDWGLIVIISIGGLIGTFIGSGIKKVIRKEEDQNW